MAEQSGFLNPGAVTKANRLAIVQLAKDDFIPVYLRETEGEHDGYKEGHVLNTKFGSFPHSTLIGIPWGSQVRASIVDTGSRGRKVKPAAQAQGEDTPEAEGLKRKRDAQDEGEKRVKSSASRDAGALAEGDRGTEQAPAEADTPSLPQGESAAQAQNPKNIPQAKQQKTKNLSAAQSGFVHILPPTPEIWTTSLPHRTQVVYTPDYSYILQRLRARPGTRLIEAGSGSGSFTHASARAVYDGSPSSVSRSRSSPPTGRVFSFEFHEQRFEKMKREVHEHGLSSFVEVRHRDVYNGGFLVDGGRSPAADAVFLDLPAPWLALPHLARRKPNATNGTTTGVDGGVETKATTEDEAQPWVSPLNPKKSVYICTFSPCIEQVTRTVSEMRKLGWVEIEMVEISHKRIQVIREKLGLALVSDRGQQLAPKNVAEAVVKLREIEAKSAEHTAKMMASQVRRKPDDDNDDDDDEEMEEGGGVPQAVGGGLKENGKACYGYLGEEASSEARLKPFLQGHLVTRPETELKAHTSYLVFAVLPREWTEEDEAAAAAKWPTGKEPRPVGGFDRAARKQAKRDLLQSKRKKNPKKSKEGKAAETATGEANAPDASMAEDVNVEDEARKA